MVTEAIKLLGVSLPYWIAYIWFQGRSRKSAPAPQRQNPFGEAEGVASVCIATCTELLEAGRDGSSSWSSAGLDEFNLYRALKARGVSFHVRSWSDPSVDWKAYKCVIPRTVWDYSECEARAFAYSRWLARVKRGGVKVLNHERIQTWNIHKAYLKEITEEWDARGGTPGDEWEVASIPSVLVQAGTPSNMINLSSIMAERGWDEVMIKPAVGGGSKDCFRVLESAGGAGVAAGQAFLLKHASGAPSIHGSSSQDARSDSQPLPSSSRADILRLGHKPPPPVMSSGDTDAVLSPISSAETVERLMQEASILLHEGSSPQDLASHPAQDMMILPYLSSVETQGELTVVWVAGAGAVQAVTKVPRPGDYRCQEEFEAVTKGRELTPQLRQLASRVLEGALAVVEKTQPPLDSSTSPSSALSTAASLPCPLPPDSLLLARIDFLPLTPALHARAFGKGFKGRRVPLQGRTPLLILEVELIEPALFFSEAKASGIPLPDILVGAIEKVVKAGGAPVAV